MKVLYEQSLVEEVRKLSQSSKKRVWIASPYIGDIQSVQKIIGNKWLNKADLSVRLLSDIEEVTQLSYETLEAFYKAGSIKSLRGLHAKIYIFDEKVIVTSANLTGTAFSKRYEMGVLLDENEAEDAISRYEHWWKNIATSVPLEKLQDLKNRPSNRNSKLNEPGVNLPALWTLPLLPDQVSDKSNPGKLKDFEYFMACYESLAKIYASFQRLAPEMPLYLEVDGLLDYLFHHGTRQSFNYATNKQNPRMLTEQQRKEEVKRYAQEYKIWVENDKNIVWRLERAQFIQGLLNPNAINTLKDRDIRNVLDRLNCMNSRSVNKIKLLNNNKRKEILKNWANLIHGQEDVKIRMVSCKNALYGFGDSSVQELIAFYSPEIYPIRNGNSNAGLRFFGYDVAI